MNQTVPESLDIACHTNVFVASVDSPGFESSLAAIAGAGFRRLVLPPLDAERTDTARLRQQLADAGLHPITLTGQSPDANVGDDDAEVRARGLAALKASVDLTVALGGDQLNGVPYGLLAHAPAAADPAAVRRAAQLIGEAADYAGAAGVAMTFEVLNRYETNVVNTAHQAMEFAEASGSDNLFIHLDTFHMAIEEDDIEGAVRTALPRLRYLELGQSGRGVFGTGAIDVAGIMRDALDAGYTGRWGIEAFSRSIIPDDVANMLAVWRETYAEGEQVVSTAVTSIRQGWNSSIAGRRLRRLSRVAPEIAAADPA